MYRDRAVVEFKTTESTRVLKEPYEHHVKQLKFYMSVLGSPYGKLLYMLLGYSNKIENYFPEYLILFNYKRERDEILHEIETKAVELQNGIDHKDPSLVKHIAANQTFIRYGRNWLCSDCPYQKSCNDMRAKAGEFAAQARKAEEEGTFTMRRHKSAL